MSEYGVSFKAARNRFKIKEESDGGGRLTGRNIIEFRPRLILTEDDVTHVRAWLENSQERRDRENQHYHEQEIQYGYDSRQYADDDGYYEGSDNHVKDTIREACTGKVKFFPEIQGINSLLHYVNSWVASTCSVCYGRGYIPQKQDTCECEAGVALVAARIEMRARTEKYSTEAMQASSEKFSRESAERQAIYLASKQKASSPAAKLAGARFRGNPAYPKLLHKARMKAKGEQTAYDKAAARHVQQGGK